MLEIIAITVACAGLSVGAVAIGAVARLRSRVRSQPRPFWAGKAPVRGERLDTRYRYDHIPEAFDWLQPGERIYIGSGSWLEKSAKKPSLTGQPAEQAAAPEHVEAAAGAHVNPTAAAHFDVERGTYMRTPEGHAAARRETEGQLNRVVGIPAHCPACQPGLAEVARPESTRGEPNTFDGYLHQATVDHAYPELTVRLRIETSLVAAGSEQSLPVFNHVVAVPPQRHELEPHPVSPKRPDRIDDAKHRANAGSDDRHPLHPIHSSPIHDPPAQHSAKAGA